MGCYAPNIEVNAGAEVTTFYSLMGISSKSEKVNLGMVDHKEAPKYEILKCQEIKDGNESGKM